jgi:hypothetical protein
MAAGVDDTPARQRQARRRRDLTAYWKEPPMSNRDFGVVLLGRFLVVERYRETRGSSSTLQPPSPGPDRTGGDADKPDSSGGSRAPALPAHG